MAKEADSNRRPKSSINDHFAGSRAVSAISSNKRKEVERLEASIILN
jgi:hypothetical protein